MIACLCKNFEVEDSIPVAVTWISDITHVLSMDFLKIKANKKCRFTLKRVCDMIKTHS